MTWLNAWAWLGLLTLIVPVLIHLLARHSARVQPFPTLRFLDSTRLRPARRRRVSDPLLLLVRMAILAAAVAALAQPLIVAAVRGRATTQVTRAIIVDSSASMLRDPAVFAQAREAAEAELGEADIGRIIVAAEPGRMIPGAAAWLATQPGTRELIIVSDFQLGEFTASDFENIPAEAGVRAERIVMKLDTMFELSSAHGAYATTARVVSNAEHVAVEWHVHDTKASAAGTLPLLLTGPDEAKQAAATRDAALAAGAPLPSDPTRRVAIVFPHHAARTQLMRAAQPLDQPWQGDILAGIARDTTITAYGSSLLDGRSTFLLFTNVEPGTLAAAQVVSTVLLASAQRTPPSELEHRVVDDATLATWQRVPTGNTNPHHTSHGRWLWLVALLLLAFESWLRRTNHQVVEAHDERAA